MPAVKLRLEITAVDLHLFRDPRQTLEQGTRISTRLPYSQAILSVKPPSYRQRATAPSSFHEIRRDSTLRSSFSSLNRSRLSKVYDRQRDAVNKTIYTIVS